MRYITQDKERTSCYSNVQCNLWGRGRRQYKNITPLRNKMTDSFLMYGSLKKLAICSVQLLLSLIERLCCSSDRFLGLKDTLVFLLLYIQADLFTVGRLSEKHDCIIGRPNVWKIFLHKRQSLDRYNDNWVKRVLTPSRTVLNTVKSFIRVNILNLTTVVSV